MDQAAINQAAALIGHGARSPGQAAFWLPGCPLPSSSPHRPVAKAVNLERRLRVARIKEKGSVLLNQTGSILVDFRVPERQIRTL